MALTRKFIDWNRPILPAVVEDLQNRYAVMGHCDLTDVVMVFPGGQAGRRFQELLTVATDGRCVPPRIMTVGRLPEYLYEPKRPFASDMTQRLAWGEALRRIPRQRLTHVLKAPPEEDDVDSWLALGELLSKQHRELAADLLDFGDVAQRGQEIPGFTEHERWNVLKEIQQEYLAILDELQLWDQQTARLVAIDLQECSATREIVLVGAGDINRTLRAMLEQVKSNVTAYVHAPQELEKRFDDYGCLRAEEWAAIPIDLKTEQIIVTDRVTDQADAVARTISGYDARWGPDDICVGVPDERVVPFVRRTLDQCGLPSRWVVERPVGESEPYLLLMAAAEYLDGEGIQELSSLVRHPDLADWFIRQGLPRDWLTCFDSYLADHLPRKLDEFLGDNHDSRTVKRMKLLLDELLAALRSATQRLAAWGPAIMHILKSVYKGVRFSLDANADRVILESCREIQETLWGHDRIPEQLMPELSASQAIRLTLSQVRSIVIPPLETGPAIQISGWLELPLDDAPALIVTGFNEGRVPASVNHDLFLPESLRCHLGLEDNARRYARDCYALQVLLNSREHVTVIVGQRDLEDEPLTPSRLLFAADPETVAARVQQCFRKVPQAVRQPLPGELSTTRSRSAFSIPQPTRAKVEKETFRVTEFADYLASPYRYYLKHILNLGSLADDHQELHAAAFGNLIHDVLQDFGSSKLISADDSLEIRHFVDKSVDRHVLRMFGKSPLYPVRLQVEQARLRLHDFADWQAEWVRKGWQLRFAEASVREPVRFQIDGKRSILLRGRIDRIDYHPRTGEWMILDYKTGDAGADPETSHRYHDEWIDLQLPLYRHLARSLNVPESAKLAYIALPREGAAVEEKIAEWSAEELQQADEVARQVVKRIWKGDFWEELEAPSGRMIEYDMICQAMVAENEVCV